MKALIVIVVIVGVAFGGWHFYNYWETLRKKEEPKSRAQPAVQQTPPSQLAGLPPALEASLQTAQRQGANGLRNWLITYGNSVKDPRLASIELDYVVLVARTDPAEAKRVFSKVKRRTLPSSPVYSRVKDLEKTYE